MFAPFLDVEALFFVAGAKGSAPCKSEPKVKVLQQFLKNDGRRRTFEEDLQRCMSPGRRKISIRYVWRSDRKFPERGCIVERILRFA
jgi:hypothetical protein